MVVVLASEDASYVSGQTLYINGGLAELRGVARRGRHELPSSAGVCPVAPWQVLGLWRAVVLSGSVGAGRDVLGISTRQSSGICRPGGPEEGMLVGRYQGARLTSET